jgi:Tfp pilus assembly protein PilV
MFNKHKKNNKYCPKGTGRNLGQTLIETLAAVFILSMGVSAAVGLAVYAFGASGAIVKQIIATGLAREGLEAVRNMRDTNWLQDTLGVNNCYNFSTGTANKANCYANWLNKYYCVDPANNSGNACNGAASGVSSVSYNLTFSSASSNLWVLTPQLSGAQNYGLLYDANNLANPTVTGFYNTAGGITCANGANSGGLTISDYCRKIIITKLTPSGSSYDPNTYGPGNPGPLLEVQSQVWWVDKKCPRAADFSSAPVSCKLELDTYLTNWKNS